MIQTVKKFQVEYIINNVACMIAVEAADLETAKVAINQWRVRKLRETNNKIRITKISLCVENFPLTIVK